MLNELGPFVGRGVLRVGVKATAFAWLPFVLLISAASASAQVVLGRVVSEDNGEPIRGALITLLGADEAPTKNALSNVRGMFLMVAPAAGLYRVRAEMIGHSTFVSDVLPVGTGTMVLTITLRSRPIELDGLVVEGASRCTMKADAAGPTLRVWQEIRKALRSQSVVDRLGTFEYGIERTRRTFDPRTHHMLSEETTSGTVVGPRPFTTLPAEELAERGYAWVESDEMRLHGPSSLVLLSPEFEQTHCFSLRKGQNGEVGLVFEPIAGRQVTDIAGVLWVEESTAELRRLEFNFRRLPSEFLSGRYAGFMEFQRLERGAWIIVGWQLNTPAVQEGAEVTTLEPVQTSDGPWTPLVTRSAPSARALVR